MCGRSFGVRAPKLAMSRSSQVEGSNHDHADCQSCNGFHVHTICECTPPFTSALGHFNPGGAGQRPAERFLAEAARRDVGVLARVPLASGLLTGKLTKETVFDESDHRRFNRHGEAFDMGETFAGVDYETGLAVVDELALARPDRRHTGSGGAALDPHV